MSFWDRLMHGGHGGHGGRGGHGHHDEHHDPHHGHGYRRPDPLPSQPYKGSAGSACSGCGSLAAPGARFCAQCGNRIAPAQCGACQTEMPAGARFCPQCGKAPAGEVGWPPDGPCGPLLRRACAVCPKLQVANQGEHHGQPTYRKARAASSAPGARPWRPRSARPPRQERAAHGYRGAARSAPSARRAQAGRSRSPWSPRHGRKAAVGSGVPCKRKGVAAPPLSGFNSARRARRSCARRDRCDRRGTGHARRRAGRSATWAARTGRSLFRL